MLQTFIKDAVSATNNQSNDIMILIQANFYLGIIILIRWLIIVII